MVLIGDAIGDNHTFYTKNIGVYVLCFMLVVASVKKQNFEKKY